MQVRTTHQGKLNLFRLSKLGCHIPNELFMDGDGNVYYKEQHRPAEKTFVFWPIVYDAAREHPDWESDTK